jgi:hypothetical protein
MIRYHGNPLIRDNRQSALPDAAFTPGYMINVMNISEKNWVLPAVDTNFTTDLKHSFHDKGDIVVDLYEDTAPYTVLFQISGGSGWYDNNEFLYPL